MRRTKLGIQFHLKKRRVFKRSPTCSPDLLNLGSDMGLVVLPNKATDSLGKQKNLGVHSQELNVWHDVTVTVGSVMPLNHGHRAWRSQVESDLAPMSQDRCAWCVGSELQLGFTLTPPAYPLGPRERPAFCDRWPQHESHAEVSPHISGLTCQYLLAEQATLPNPGWTKDGGAGGVTP